MGGPAGEGPAASGPAPRTPPHRDAPRGPPAGRRGLGPETPPIAPRASQGPSRAPRERRRPASVGWTGAGRGGGSSGQGLGSGPRGAGHVGREETTLHRVEGVGLERGPLVGRLDVVVGDVGAERLGGPL